MEALLRMTLHHSGRIEMICGSMFSGKTEELIRRTRRAVIADRKCRCSKPAIDIRFAEQKVVSHNGADYGAIPVNSAESIFTLLDPDTTVVAIDEVQFFRSGRRRCL